jgi:hypothetical protein
MTRATGAASLTGTRRLHNSITGEPEARPQSPERLIAVAQSREDRTSHAAALTTSRVAARAAAAISPGEAAPIQAWTVAEAQRVTSAAAAVPAGRAAAAAVSVAAAEAAVLAVVAVHAVAAVVVVVAAEAGGRYENIQKINPGICKGDEDDAFRNEQ